MQLFKICASLGKAVKWKVRVPRYYRKGGLAKNLSSVPSTKGILDCFDCCVYFVLPSLLCLEQRSTWDRLWSAEGGKRSFSSYFSFSFSWQTTFQDGGEEVEDGAVYNVTLKKVQIQQAANKGARWLGVSEASTGQLGRAAHGLRSRLQAAEFHRNCYNINF